MTYMRGDGIPALPFEPGPSGPAFANPAKSKAVFPQFFLQTRKNADGTFTDVEMVRWHIAGDMKSQCEQRVTDPIREAWYEMYGRWRQGLQMAAEGTPLEQWPVMAGQPALVQTLKSLNIFTVEALSDVNESALAGILGGRRLRDLARAYLEACKRSNPLEKLSAENEQLKNEVELLRKQIAEISARAEQQIAAASGAAPHHGRK